MSSTEGKRKRAPISTITVIATIIVIIAALTYIVPAGEFDRIETETGRTVVVPGSYHAVEATPVSFPSLMAVVYNAVIAASSLIGFVFVVGGAFGIINRTGAVAAGLNRIVNRLKGKETVIILIVMALFCVGGATYGMAEETIPFVAIMIAVAIKMGFDPIVGVSMVILGTYAGYAGGALNPFNTAIAQEICELPMFSGIGLRVVLTIGAFAIIAHHVISYGFNYKKKVADGLIAADFEDYVPDETLTGEIREMNGMDKIVLAVLFATIGVLIYGVLAHQWYFEEMAALFMTMGIVIGMIYYRGNFNLTMKAFIDGAKDMAGTVLVVAMARGVLIMMQSGGIMDTFIYWLSKPLTGLPAVLTAWGMYLAQAVINFAIPSSSGQATAVMPIFSSLADLTSITRQTAILAYQCGDGFWNMITPAHATTMACIGIGGISFGKWFKYAFPLVLKLSAWIFAVLAFAVVTGYGPF